MIASLIINCEAQFFHGFHPSIRSSIKNVELTESLAYNLNLDITGKDYYCKNNAGEKVPCAGTNKTEQVEESEEEEPIPMFYSNYISSKVAFISSIYLIS